MLKLHFALLSSPIMGVIYAEAAVAYFAGSLTTYLGQELYKQFRVILRTRSF